MIIRSAFILLFVLKYNLTTLFAQQCFDKNLAKPDRPDLAWEQEIKRTKDPSLGYVPFDGLQKANQQTSLKVKQQKSYKTSAAIPNINWVERGPNNVAGRTRALMFDPNDGTHKKVWAGGVTGGLWYNTDITDENSSWQKVDDFWSNITVTCIASDPNDPQIFYVGTGESRAGSGRGAGIWKTIDGGTTWNQLAATTDLYFVNDIIVRNESGTSVLYAAIPVSYYVSEYHGNSEGMQRSVDGGATFSQVMPNIPSTTDPFRPVDIELGADNRIYVGTADRLLSDGSTIDGGGYILFSDDGTNWTVVSDYSSVTDVGRVELACAPSNVSIVYGIIEAGTECERIIKSSDRGVTWSDMTEPVDVDGGIPPTDFTRNQAWYDLSLAVDPNDDSRLVIGGIDLFISTDGASSWQQISQWVDFGEDYSVVHADQHAAVFWPGSSDTIIFSNDGGIFFTDRLDIATTSDIISSRNKNYNVTQFYSCAVDPTAGSDIFLAGAQDNGTQYYETSGVNATTEIYGGDGGYCFIDQDEPDYSIVSYVYNSYYLYDPNNGWITLSEDQSSGDFINPAAYDSQENILYSAYDASDIQIVTDITSGSPSLPTVVAIGLDDYASHFRVSPYSSSGNSVVFIGTHSGSVYKVLNAQSGSPTVSNITGNLPVGSISSIDVGASDNDLLVTYFNYGITSVWQTANGGTTWTNKEGNLPDMPVRWCLYNPDDRDQVMLATETGVWSTDDVSVVSPDWEPTNTGLANVRVDMLQYRTSDKLVAAATYGRGLFTTTGLTVLDVTLPVANSFTPLDNATNVSASSNLTIVFSESIQKGTGNILIKESGITTQTISVVSANVSVSGAIVVIDPSSDFSDGAAVNIEIAGTAFKDLANNNYVGISNATTWNFTVTPAVDITAPTVTSFSPADNATGVSVSSNLTIVFSESIQKGTGNIFIKESGITTQTISVGSANVSVSGTTAIIDPSSDFSSTAAVNIEIAATAFKDLANNNYAGISDATTWNFTAGPNSIKSLNSIKSSLKLHPNPTEGNITIYFSVEETTAVIIRILNINGQAVYEDNATSLKGTYSNTIDLSENARGIYFLQIVTDKENLNKKIIVR